MISRRTMMNDKISEEKGNRILLNKCKGSYLSSSTLYGKSTQGSTTWAQLFDEKNVVDGFIAGNGILTQPNVNQKEKTSDYIPIPKETKPTSVTATALGAPTSGNYLWIGVSFYGADKAFISRPSNSSGVGAKKYVLKANIPPEAEYLRLSYQKYEDVVVMLNFGENEMPYEPYSGGKPSPSPSYPQEIENVGQSGEIGVEVCGKNLIPFPYPALGGAGMQVEKNGVKYTVQSDGGIKCMGTPTDVFGVRLSEIKFSDMQLSVQNPTDGKVVLSGGDLFFDSNNNSLFIYFKVSQVGKPIDTVIYPQIELGTVATAYEPYKPAQKLIIPTPDGLHGIPVNAGGNYTDEKGQQWVCDEIDLAKGERVQWIENKVLEESDLRQNNPNWKFVYLNNIKTVTNADPICSHLKYVYYQTADKEPIQCISRVLDDIRIYLNSTDFQVYKDFVNNNEIRVIWALKTPIRTPLPPETIAAYKKLHTYSPTTTVINDADAGMSVGYRKVRG